VVLWCPACGNPASIRLAESCTSRSAGASIRRTGLDREWGPADLGRLGRRSVGKRAERLGSATMDGCRLRSWVRLR
jgi:hypothetical protein